MTQETLNKRIKTTTDLRGIVSTMKMLSSVSVGQFERALKSLNQYTENLQNAFRGLFAQENFQYIDLTILKPVQIAPQKRMTTFSWY